MGVIERLGTSCAAAEVEAVLEVSLEELLDPEVYREELWPEPAGGSAPLEDPSGLRRMHFFELYGDTVWGATARIVPAVDDRAGTDTRAPPPVRS